MTTQLKETNTIFWDLDDFISVLKKRRKLLLIIYVILLSSFSLYNLVKRTVYQTNFTLVSPITNNGTENFTVNTKGVVENFTLLYGSGGIYRNEDVKTNELSEDILNLDKIEITNTDINSPSETSLKIRMFVYDTTSINTITQTLVAYCNHNKLLCEKINSEKEKIIQTKECYQNELNALISNKQKTEKENKISEMNFDIYIDIAELKGKILKLENELQDLKGIEIGVEPVIPRKPIGLSLPISLIISSTLGLVLCAFLVFYIDKFLLFWKKQ